MEQDGKIPTAQHVETFELQGGGTLQVRRLSKVKIETIMGAAALKDGDTQSSARFVRLIFQCAVVGAAIDGFEFKQVKHSTLGMIAPVELYERDEVTGDDVTGVMAFATRDMLGKTRGN